MLLDTLLRDKAMPLEEHDDSSSVMWKDYMRAMW